MNPPRNILFRRRHDLVAAVLSGLWLAACGVEEPPKLELPSAETATAPAAKPEVTSVIVDTVVITPQQLAEEVVLTGELRAAESVTIRAETSGRAVSLHFTEGQAIDRGALMVKINDAELAAERKRTALRRDLAAQREKRFGALVAEGTISQDVYDEAASELAVFEAELELFDARIAETEIRAPFAGIVGLRAISVGSYVTPQTAITSLQALNPMKIDISAAERHASRFARGDRVTFTVAGNDQSFNARVYAIEPRIDAETRTIVVRAEAPNPTGALLPGAFAKVRLVLDSQDDALLVPSIALVPGLDSTTVFVVENGHAATRRVRTGRRTHVKVEILGGLAAGDEVIVSGIQHVRPGTPVIVEPRAATTSALGTGTASIAAGG